jgi:hypothetical protein
MHPAEDDGAQTARDDVDEEFGDLDEKVVGLGHPDGDELEDPFPVFVSQLVSVLVREEGKSIRTVHHLEPRDQTMEGSSCSLQ